MAVYLAPAYIGGLIICYRRKHCGKYSIEKGGGTYVVCMYVCCVYVCVLLCVCTLEQLCLIRTYI